jgi:hypothetical protein
MPDPISSLPPSARSIDLEPIVVTGAASKPEAPPLPLADIALNCFDEADTVAVALLTQSAPSPTVAALAAFGLAYDFGACAAKTIATSEKDASIARALARCDAEGGTALGVVGNTLSCAVVVEE